MKALILTGDKVQDHEFIYPYYRLKEEGAAIVVATKDGEPVKGYLGTNVPSDKDCQIILYKHLEQHMDIDLLILPGGAKCMEYMRQEFWVINFIKEYFERGGVVSSICHGAQLLISAGIVKGKKVSGYYSIRDDINNAGAEYTNLPFVEDGKLITCPHYKHLGEWMKRTLEITRENSHH